MESLSEIIFSNASHAYWYVFIAIILAGFNVPISIDLVVLAAAVLAAVIVPEQMLLLFFSVLVGCILSAWCAYWIGRLVGTRLLRYRFFYRLFPTERVSKIRGFYERHGLLALVVGRFIPFGVRNCLFISTGISRVSFFKFMWMDAIACSIWVSAVFSLFYSLGHHYEAVWHYVKTFNGLLFVAFSVTVIGLFWYKRKKKLFPSQVAAAHGVKRSEK